jgi:hypothetical protein
VEVDGHSSLEVQAFVNNIFDQYGTTEQSRSYFMIRSVADAMIDIKMPMIHSQRNLGH